MESTGNIVFISSVPTTLPVIVSAISYMCSCSIRIRSKDNVIHSVVNRSDSRHGDVRDCRLTNQFSLRNCIRRYLTCKRQRLIGYVSFVKKDNKSNESLSFSDGSNLKVHMTEKKK